MNDDYIVDEFLKYQGTLVVEDGPFQYSFVLELFYNKKDGKVQGHVSSSVKKMIGEVKADVQSEDGEFEIKVGDSSTELKDISISHISGFVKPKNDEI